MLLIDLVDAETGQRGFIITGKNKFLEPYNDALHHVSSRITELKQLTKDNPSQQKRLDSIQILTDRKLAELALTIRVQKSQGFETSKVMVENNIGKATMDSIRLNIANAQNDEHYLLNERTRNYDNYSHRLNVVLVSGVIAAILILLVIIILLRYENSVRTRVEKELMIQKNHLNDLVNEATSDLMASERRWATTLASLADAVIATDETGHITFMNETAESTTGWSIKEALNKPLHEVFKIMSEEDHQPLTDPFAKVLKEGAISDIANHTLLVKKDGKEIPIDNSGTRMHREDGALMGVVLVFHDSTKHRQAEEASRNQAALLNFAHDAIIVRNAEDKITFWNRGAEETYGWVQEEAVGRVIHDLFKTRFPRPMEEIYEEADQIGEWNGELIHTRKDGQEIVVASRWAIQRDIWGRHLATLEINRDITESKKVEEELRESEDRFRTMANAMPQLAWIAYADGFIYWYNRRCYEYTGKNLEQLEGWGWQSIHDPQVLPRVLERWKGSIATGEPLDMEFPLLGADGVYRLFLTRVMPLKDSSGRVMQWFGTSTDINDLKQLEDQLDRRANDLAASNHELESFSYSVAHDLRSPLYAMIGFIKILQEDYSEKLDDEGKEYLSRVANSAERKNELIGDILSLSKVSRQEMQYRDVDMSRLAYAIISDLEQSDPSRIIDISVEENLHVYADENLLRLALQNLLSNAWKYTGKVQYPCIELGAFEKDGKRIFYVRDNGTGFDMKNADKLFVPFKRLHKESDFPGVGVGLPIVDRVIRRHGGRIWAEGESGKGATFFFTLAG